MSARIRNRRVKEGEEAQQQDTQVTKFAIRQDMTQWAVIENPKYGPTFGGVDLGFLSWGSTHRECYCRVIGAFTYKFRPGELTGKDDVNYFFIDDMEVFAV